MPRSWSIWLRAAAVLVFLGYFALMVDLVRRLA